MARISRFARLQFIPENCEIDEATRLMNTASHHIGVVDDCYRCIDCEIGSWNSWKEYCHAK